VHDRQTGTTERVSVDSLGNQANNNSLGPSISADGRYVAFFSVANNLVAGDTNRLPDVFVHEREIATQPDDSIVPTTTASATTNSGAPYESDIWTNEDVKVSLSAQDNEGGCGVKKITYSASGAQTIEQTDASGSSVEVDLNQEGTTTLTYYATDKAGNVEDQKTLTVKIDRTPPTILSTNPTNNATGVAATANISATFSESGSGMDLGTVSSSTFQVVQLKPTGNLPVSSGTFSLKEDSEGSQTVTFDPESSLAKGAYRMIITTGVKDKAGNALTNDYTWTFATAGPPSRR
jgi:hypothetical protein